MKRNGFTLIELIIVIAIMAVLSAIALPMLHAGFNSYFTERNLNDADWQGRLALSRMERDIANIPSTAVISTATSSQFTFTNNNNNSVSYTLSGTHLQRNALTLAQGIASATFGYFDKEGDTTSTIANIRYVSITLNITQNNTDITLQTVINLRDIVA